MNLQYGISLALCSILLAGCAQSQVQQSNVPLHNSSEQNLENKVTNQKPIKPVSHSSYKSQSGYYFALIEKADKGWVIIDLRDTIMSKRQNEKQEILRVSQSYSEVVPFYETTKFHRLGDTYECSYMLTPEQYSPCNSQLTSVSVGKSLGKNVVAAALTFGLAAGSHKYIDENLIDEAIVQTDLFNAIETKKVVFEKLLYERSFSNARSIADYDKFISTYTGKDEQNYIPQALVKRDELIEKQKAEQKRQEEINRKKQEDIIAKQKAEEKAMNERKKVVEAFRKSLKNGMDTNCGPILEVRDTLVKVYFPIQNYGNEHWIKRDEIFTKEYGCRFLNGGYIMPSSY